MFGLPLFTTLMVGFVGVSPVILTLFIARRRSRRTAPGPLNITRLSVVLWLVCVALLVADTMLNPQFFLTAVILAPAAAVALIIQVFLLARGTHCDLNLAGHTFFCRRGGQSEVDPPAE